jgi:hypothetical protein
LEEGIMPQGLGVIEVGIAGQDVIDRLREKGFRGVLDAWGRAGIGQSRGQVGKDAQGLLPSVNGEESGIGDETAPVEGDVPLLRAEGPQGKVRF